MNNDETKFNLLFYLIILGKKVYSLNILLSYILKPILSSKNETNEI